MARVESENQALARDHKDGDLYSNSKELREKVAQQQKIREKIVLGLQEIKNRVNNIHNSELTFFSKDGWYKCQLRNDQLIIELHDKNPEETTNQHLDYKLRCTIKFAGDEISAITVNNPQVRWGDKKQEFDMQSTDKTAALLWNPAQEPLVNIIEAFKNFAKTEDAEV